MQNTNRRSFLLNLIQKEHAQLEALLATLSDEQLLLPNITGSWSVKDVLAHLIWWEQAMISEILHEVELDPGLGGEAWSTERANALMVEAKRNTPLPEILQEFQDSYQQTLQMVESLQEADLAQDERYLHLMNNTGNHYAEHRLLIESRFNAQEA